MNKLILAYNYVTVFVVGAIVMALELLGTRIIAPYYGTTHYVWSALIVVALVFLSLGYFIGGKLADRKPKIELIYFFILISGVLLILVSKLSIKIISLTNNFGVRFGPLVSSALLFGPIFSLLGTVLPFSIKLITKKLEKIGTRTGTLYAISTIGSVIGTLFAGFVLIPNFKISVTLYLMGLILISLSLTWFLIKKSLKKLSIGLILVVIVFLMPPTTISINEKIKILDEKQSIYGKVVVLDKGNGRELLVDGAAQAIINKDTGESILEYVEYVELALDPKVNDVLVVGLGSGFLTENLDHYGLDVTSVDIDKNIAEAAKKFFGFDGDYEIADGRGFVKKSSNKYDLIVFDVYSGYTAPFHMLTKEAFYEAKLKLNDGGILVLNTAGWPDSEFQKAIFSTLKEVFGKVYVYSDVMQGFANIIFFASDDEIDFEDNLEFICSIKECDKRKSEMLDFFISNKELSIEDGIVLSDDYNPSEFFQIKSQEYWRENNLKAYGEGVLLI